MKKARALFALLVGLTAPTVLHAEAIVGGTTVQVYGDSQYADFTATLSYYAASSTEAYLQVSVANTTIGSGYLTGFIFNNPQNRISDVAFTDPLFELIADGDIQNGIKTQRGTFDLGTGADDNFNTNSDYQEGLQSGEYRIFTFGLTGTGLDMLSVTSFVNEVAQAPTNTCCAFFLTRFAAVNGGPANSTALVTGTVTGTPTATATAYAGLFLAVHPNSSQVPTPSLTVTPPPAPTSAPTATPTATPTTPPPPTSEPATPTPPMSPPPPTSEPATPTPPTSPTPPMSPTPPVSPTPPGSPTPPMSLPPPGSEPGSPTPPASGTPPISFIEPPSPPPTPPPGPGSAIPEPSTFVLLGISLAALGLRGRRQPQGQSTVDGRQSTGNSGSR